MAKRSVITLSANISGDGVDTDYTPPSAPIVNPAAPAGGPVQIALSTGANNIAVPLGAIGVIIIPPAGSVVGKTLKGVTGDIGIILGAALPTELALDSTVTTFVIAATAGETISVLWF